MNKLIINDKFIEIQCGRGDTDTKALMQHIPYFHMNRIHTVFWTSIRNIDLVLKVFRNLGPMDLDKMPPKIQELYIAEQKKRIALHTLLEQGPQREPGWLMVHQQLGREIAEVFDRFAFFYDTRTGKTPMSLQIMADDIYKHGHKWLVLCPLILIENAWLEDSRTFFPDLRVVSLHAATRAARMKQFAKDADIYLMNIEAFVSYMDEVKKLPIHGCFVDESSTMKSHSAVFAKAAVEYAHTLNRWYLLSGSPAPNGENEYYRQLESIDQFCVHQSYTQFKNYFFDNISRNPQYDKLLLKDSREAEMIQLLRRYSLYVDKEDVLTTPGRDFIPVELKLPKELKEQYAELKDTLALQVEESTIIAKSAAAKLNKLNQVSSGFIIDTSAIKYNNMIRDAQLDEEVKDESYLLSLYRFEALDRLLHNIGDNQAIIWANYHKEFDILKERLGDKCALIYGKVSINDKNQALRDFKAGKIQYLVANPASADKGLTLTNAHFAIYFSMNYSYELWKQSIERIYGDISKQKNRCTYYIFIASGTVDRVIYDTVMAKGDMSKAILDHLKGRS